MDRKFAPATLLTFLLLVAASDSAAAQSPAAPDAAAGAVRVEYPNPEKFTDVGGYGGRMREPNLEQLRRHLVSRATALLGGGQQLAVVVTEVDMAGGYNPMSSRSSSVRVVRDVYPPRIDLRFRLFNADGTLLREGERKLRNSAFLMTTALHRSDPLRYEKMLLDDWLEAELRPAGSATK